MNMLRRIANRPALRFLVFGVAILLARSWMVDSATVQLRIPSRRPIVVGPERVEQLRNHYEERYGQPADDEVLKYLVSRHVDDEILYREGVREGLDRSDPRAIARLVEKLGFLGEDQGLDPEQSYKRALELGLDKDDPVVRKLVAQKLRLRARFSDDDQAPDEALQQRYYEEHLDRYRTEARIDLSQIFFGSTVRGDTAQAEAMAMVDRAQRDGLTGSSVKSLGDPRGEGSHRYSNASGRLLDKNFGPVFTKAVFALPVGRWSGPVGSAYGFHAVLVESRTEPGIASLEDVRTNVIQSIQREQGRQREEEMLVRLRGLYEVRR